MPSSKAPRVTHPALDHKSAVYGSTPITKLHRFRPAVAPGSIPQVMPLLNTRLEEQERNYKMIKELQREVQAGEKPKRTTRATAKKQEQAQEQATVAMQQMTQVNLCVEHEHHQIWFKLRLTTPLVRLVTAYCNRMDVEQVQLMHNNEPVPSHFTPADAGLEDGDVLTALHIE